MSVRPAAWRLAVLVGGAIAIAGIAAATAQGGRDRVRLILSNLPPHASAAYQATKRRAGKSTGQVLPLTKSEMWSVPKQSAAAVKSAAAEHGLGVHELDDGWNHILQPASPDIKLSNQQKAMVDRIRSSKATRHVGIMVASAPAAVEYALTADAHNKQSVAKIVLAINAETSLAVTRVSVDLKSDMCVWRGSVDGTDASATIMWWPRGKMAGTIHHGGRIYSIQHLGEDIFAVIEMSEQQMPDDHPPPRRMPLGGPAPREALADDPSAPW